MDVLFTFLRQKKKSQEPELVIKQHDFRIHDFRRCAIFTRLMIVQADNTKSQQTLTVICRP